MRIVSNIFVLLPFLFQSISAIDLPRGYTPALEQTSDRDLFVISLFRNWRCNRRAAKCEKKLDVKELPIEEWSDAALALEDEVEDDEETSGVVALIQNVLALAANLDIGAAIANLTNGAFDGGLVSTVLAVLGNVSTIYAALQDGDILAVISMILDMLTDTSDAFSAARDNELEQIIEGIVLIVSGIAGLFADLVEVPFLLIIYTLESLINFLVGFLEIFIDAVDDRQQRIMSCRSELVECQYNTMMVESIPNLISLTKEASEAK